MIGRLLGVVCSLLSLDLMQFTLTPVYAIPFLGSKVISGVYPTELT